MSNVSFKGNIGKVRTVEFGNDGQARIGFSVAEGHSRLDKQTNQWQETGTTWWNVTVFGKQAEALSETLQEGAKQRVVVAGRAQTRDYESNGEKRTSLDVIADLVGIIPKAQQAGNSQQQSGGFGSSQPPANSGGWGAPSGGQQQPQGGWGNPGEGPAF